MKGSPRGMFVRHTYLEVRRNEQLSTLATRLLEGIHSSHKTAPLVAFPSMKIQAINSLQLRALPVMRVGQGFFDDSSSYGKSCACARRGCRFGIVDLHKHLNGQLTHYYYVDRRFMHKFYVDNQLFKKNFGDVVHVISVVFPLPLPSFNVETWP